MYAIRSYYVNYISYIRESIHLVVLGKKNPLDEFNSIAMVAYMDIIADIDKDIVNKFIELSIESINENGVITSYSIHYTKLYELLKLKT